MKKQLISSVACFVLLILMFVGSSIAWFTDTADSVNTMVAGKISIDQTEEFDGTQILLPSMTITKKVTVKIPAISLPMCGPSLPLRIVLTARCWR